MAETNLPELHEVQQRSSVGAKPTDTSTLPTPPFPVDAMSSLIDRAAMAAPTLALPHAHVPLTGVAAASAVRPRTEMRYCCRSDQLGDEHGKRQLQPHLLPQRIMQAEDPSLCNVNFIKFRALCSMIRTNRLDSDGLMKLHTVRSDCLCCPNLCGHVGTGRVTLNVDS